VQYNKQDLPGCQGGKHVEDALQTGKQGVCASAIQGVGVMETFRLAVVEMLNRLAAPSGRRRADDLKGLEEQISKTFERFAQRASAFAGGAGAQRHAEIVEPGSFERGENGRSSPDGGAQNPLAALPQGHGTQVLLPPGLQGGEPALGEDLLLRSLRATLGIAEQYGEMREVKNRLARRVGELEGLQALARDLSTRRDVASILNGLADAAMAIPGARAASVLTGDASGNGLSGVVLRGLSREPLLEGEEGSRAADELMRRGEARLLDRLPVRDGRAMTEAGVVGSAIAVRLAPALRPTGLVMVYGESPFGAEDARFLGLLAAHAAVCLDNAEMTIRLTLYNEKLEADVRARTAQLERANEELRELDKMKDRFLSSISHELKTPLTGIVAGAELLSSLMAENDHAREFLAMIDHEGRRLALLVDRILRFQVMGRGPTSQCSETLDLRELVTKVVQEASFKAAVREVGIAIDLPERMPKIAGDEEALDLALREIIDNAVKFSPATGIVQVVAREKLVRWTGQGPHDGDSAAERSGARADWDELFLVITVSDCGPGIALDDQTRIFERFEQLGDLLTAKPNGLGLGLPIARAVARRHGGDLLVQSPANGGSEFRLYLPVQTGRHTRASDGIVQGGKS
jgi:signal transduction histidine kinase